MSTPSLARQGIGPLLQHPLVVLRHSMLTHSPERLDTYLPEVHPARHPQRMATLSPVPHGTLVLRQRQQRPRLPRQLRFFLWYVTREFIGGVEAHVSDMTSSA